MRAQHESRFDKNRAERVGIVTDSTCDLPPSMLEDLGVGVVPGARLLRLGELPRQGHDHAVRVLRALRRHRRGAQDVAAAARRLHAGLRERGHPRRRDRVGAPRIEPLGDLPGGGRRGAARARRRRSSTWTAGTRRWGSASSCARPPRPPRQRQERRRGGDDRARDGRARAALRGGADDEAPRARRPGVGRAGLHREAARPAADPDDHAGGQGRGRRQGPRLRRRAAQDDGAALRRGRRPRERLAPLRGRALRRGGRRRGDRPRDPRALSRVRRHDRRVRAGARGARRARARWPSPCFPSPRC